VSTQAQIPIDVTLSRDAAALVALWLQIYGGDPPPQEVQLSPTLSLAAAALVAQLSEEYRPSAEPLSNHELADRLRRLGLELGDGAEHDANEVEAAFRLPSRCTCVRVLNEGPGCCVCGAFLLVSAEAHAD